MLERESRKRQIFNTKLLVVRASPALLALAGLGGLGLYVHGDTIAPTGKLKTYHFDNTELYAAIRALPGRPLLGVHPRTASEIPLMAGRSVVISAEVAHPWWTVYWKECVERTHDILTASFTNRPAVLLAITRKYDIDYWVVDRGRYRSSLRKTGGMRNEPFAGWAKKNLPLSSRSVLRRIPRRFRHWDDKRTFFIVARSDLERYIESRLSKP